MDSFMKADIFFFVTTIMSVIVGILAIIALAYVIKAAKTFQRLVRRAEMEADKLFTAFYFIKKVIKLMK